MPCRFNPNSSHSLLTESSSDHLDSTVYDELPLPERMVRVAVSPLANAPGMLTVTLHWFLPIASSRKFLQPSVSILKKVSMLSSDLVTKIFLVSPFLTATVFLSLAVKTRGDLGLKVNGPPPSPSSPAPSQAKATFGTNVIRSKPALMQTHSLPLILCPRPNISIYLSR